MEIETKIEFQEILKLIKKNIIQLDFDKKEHLTLIQIEEIRQKEEQKINALLKDLQFEDIAEWINYHKLKGNEYLQEGQNFEALHQYYLAIIPLWDEKILRQFGVNILNNIQIVLTSLNKPLTQEILEYIIYLDSKCHKAYYKLGKFYSQKGDKKKALELFRKGLNIVPKNDTDSYTDFQKEISKLR